MTDVPPLAMSSTGVALPGGTLGRAPLEAELGPNVPLSGWAPASTPEIVRPTRSRLPVGATVSSDSHWVTRDGRQPDALGPDSQQPLGAVGQLTYHLSGGLHASHRADRLARVEGHGRDLAGHVARRAGHGELR